MTPDQLEEFEAVFLHFDRERTNSLNNVEFGSALASLGLNYEPEEMEDVFAEVGEGRGRVNFEQFIRFMVFVFSLVTDGRWSCMRIRLLLTKYGRHFAMLQRERLFLYEAF